MNAIAQKIDALSLLTRPAYDDTELGNEGLWVMSNADLLAKYWQQLGRALGIDDTEGEEDLMLFCSEQHRQQMREHPGYMYERLPHGSSL